MVGSNEWLAAAPKATSDQLRRPDPDSVEEAGLAAQKIGGAPPPATESRAVDVDLFRQQQHNSDKKAGTYKFLPRASVIQTR